MRMAQGSDVPPHIIHEDEDDIWGTASRAQREKSPCHDQSEKKNRWQTHAKSKDGHRRKIGFFHCSIIKKPFEAPKPKYDGSRTVTSGRSGTQESGNARIISQAPTPS